jgi:hypothetical protein
MGGKSRICRKMGGKFEGMLGDEEKRHRVTRWVSNG